MSKYDHVQLKAMARTALRARDAGDQRYFMLVMQVAIKSGLDANTVERKIEQLAN